MTTFFKKCWISLAILIILAAIISSFFRALTPWAKQYKVEVEQHLTAMLGKPVTISTMETGWYWFEPVVKLNQVSINNGQQQIVKLSNLLVGINLFSSLWHWQLQPGVLFIEDLNLNFRQIDKRWQIDGLFDNNQQMMLDSLSFQPIAAWILAQQKIVIKNLSANIYLQDGTFIPLNEFNLLIVNQRGHYNIKGKGQLDQATNTNFQLLADLTLASYDISQATGHLFFSLHRILPVQWQAFVPQSRFHFADGIGDISLWADIKKGAWENIQTKLFFHELTWADNQTQKTQTIQDLSANLAWKPTNEGWQLAGDHIQLNLAGKNWPENTLLVNYKKATNTYSLFIKNILLQSLAETSIVWPDSVHTIFAKKPQGHFFDTQIQISDTGLTYALTRFSGLGWQAFANRPSVSNLSGAIHWQPHQGRLELNSKNTTINAKTFSSVNFSTVDAAFDWQKQSNGLRLTIEKFNIKNPELLIHSQGIIDQITDNSLGRLQLSADFTADNAQQWFKYLPKGRLKPKLEVWLKKDIKRIQKLSGNLAINGLATDFPFDKQPGEFSIRTNLSGVDLVFARNWPLTTDITGNLRIDKRNLVADINHANLQGISIDQLNLRIADIGLDHETLQVQSAVTTQSDKALGYVMLSPLQKKLSALNVLKMQGLLSLDLHLEVPLYPENDAVLAHGNIHFTNNQVAVNYSMIDLLLKDFNGTLEFNQEGVATSNLTAILYDSPVKLAVQSIHKPKALTEIKMEGQTSIETLKKKFNLVSSPLITGSLGITSIIQLSDDPKEFNHLKLLSNLNGLVIDLPSPLGKIAQNTAPLTLNLDFSAQKAARLHVNYDNRISGDFLFSAGNDSFRLAKGEIRLGNGEASSKKQAGLHLVGTLPQFDLQEWMNTKAKLPINPEKNDFVDKLNSIDIKLQEAKIGPEHYKELVINADKLTDKEWFIHLEQARLAANLRYYPQNNTIKGQVDKLILTKDFQQTAHFNQSLKPSDLPNLDLIIKSFKLDDFNLGDISIKTKAWADRWQLEHCKINTPHYQIAAKGEWSQKGHLDNTNLRMDLHINDLAKSLEHWKITPAVEAQQGDLRFEGGWADSLSNFSMTKVKGQMGINLKNGRITHLSPETEEKLGLGKLLSILSLQTIPRRLKLDFSDLSKDGYSFDEFQGSFNLSKGVMTTQDSYINGPVAYASMKGNLDIARQLYDVDLKISPHITASLPIVATIAGGPIAGFAAWVASKIINQGMQTISGYTYKISGPWKQPKVEQVKIIRKRKI